MKEGIFKTVWELKKRGYADSTIQGYARKLKTLSRLDNLNNPESVRSLIARKKCSNAFKEALVNAYDHYAKVNGLPWKKPLYKRQRGLPYVATTEQINKIISRASKKYALIFSILRDTGLRPIEIHNLTLKSIDLEKGVITVKSAKFGNPRVLKLKTSTLAMLREYIKNLNLHLNEKLFPNFSAIRHSFARYRNIVASHLSGVRTVQDVIALFEKSMKVAKKKPTSIYVDGLPAYPKGFNKVFWTMRKDTRPELIRKVGLQAVNSNNSVERLHGTLKDRIKPMRGLKGMEPVRTLLEGWVVHYNYVRPHQSLKGKTPAQVSGIDMNNDWHTLVKEATKNQVTTEMERKQEKPLMVMAK